MGKDQIKEWCGTVGMVAVITQKRTMKGPTEKPARILANSATCLARSKREVLAFD